MSTDPLLRYLCPLCGAQIPGFGPTLFVEQALRQHVDTHTTEEWLRGLVEVKRENAKLRTALTEAHSVLKTAQMLIAEDE